MYNKQCCKYQMFLDKAPPKEWPESGDIVFQNFNLRYSPELPHTLKNLNFKIQSMEKVLFKFSNIQIFIDC